MTARTTTEDPRVSHAREALRCWDGRDWPADLLRPMAGELAHALRSLLAVVDERE